MSMLRELTRNRKADAALENERVTRGRVDKLERRADTTEKWLHFVAESFRDHMERRTFWGRLKWLVQGK